jgi:hypothetical protein
VGLMGRFRLGQVLFLLSNTQTARMPRCSNLRLGVHGTLCSFDCFSNAFLCKSRSPSIASFTHPVVGVWKSLHSWSWLQGVERMPTVNNKNCPRHVLLIIGLVRMHTPLTMFMPEACALEIGSKRSILYAISLVSRRLYFAILPLVHSNIGSGCASRHS